MLVRQCSYFFCSLLWCKLYLRLVLLGGNKPEPCSNGNYHKQCYYHSPSMKQLVFKMGVQENLFVSRTHSFLRMFSLFPWMIDFARLGFSVNRAARWEEQYVHHTYFVYQPLSMDQFSVSPLTIVHGIARVSPQMVVSGVETTVS